jgi:hypothetical protein
MPEHGSRPPNTTPLPDNPKSAEAEAANTKNINEATATPIPTRRAHLILFGVEHSFVEFPRPSCGVPTTSMRMAALSTMFEPALLKRVKNF